MNCLLVINTMSGNAEKINAKEIVGRYAVGDDVAVKYLRHPTDGYSPQGVDKLIVCGGDGTLNHALTLCGDREIDLYYLPCGTFNETAKAVAEKGISRMSDFGKIGESDFAYVAAAGSFTGLGQTTKNSLKRRFKILAYFAKVLSAYRVHRIPAEIVTEKVSEKGVYTLLMISNAKRCFGFRFNHLHGKAPERLQLIAIKAPEKDNLWGRIKMFFPFFRVFFLGIRKEHVGRNILVTSFQKGLITLSEETPFCLDGEIVHLSGAQFVRKEKGKARVYLIRE